MNRLIRIILEYTLATVVIGLLLTAIAGVVLVKFRGEELKAFVIREVNQRIDTQVDVGRTDVKVFRRFPNTSIVLEEVTLWSSRHFNTGDFEGRGGDTLMRAAYLFVDFNPFSLIFKKNRIRRIEIRDGMLNLCTDKNGAINYRFIKGEKQRKPSTQQLHLSQVKITDFRVRVDNRAKDLRSSGTLEELSMHGRFSRRNTHLRGQLIGRLEEISNDGIRYASDRDLRLKLNLDVSDTLYFIKAGRLQIDRISADVDGSFLSIPGKGVRLDLYAAAQDLNIHEVLDLFPAELTSSLKGITGGGILQIYSRITGLVNSTQAPGIEADFQTSNAHLRWDRVPFSVRNLNLKGTYSNGGAFNPVTTSLTIETVDAMVGDNRILGRASVTNFRDPEFEVVLEGEIDPGQWVDWYGRIPVEEASGIIASDMAVRGAYHRDRPRGERFTAFDVTGGVTFRDVSCLPVRGGVPLTGLNGSIRIENDLWEPVLEGRFGNSDFRVKGTGLNLLSFMTERHEPLIFSATLHSGRLDFSQVLENLSPGRAERSRRSRRPPEARKGIRFPELVNLQLDVVIDQFSQGPFSASHVRGTASYEPPFLFVDSLRMQTMDGTLNGRFGMVQAGSGDISLNVDAGLHRINITHLFRSFRNFGQKQLTSDHLEGTLSGEVSFSADFDSTFSIRTGSILSENSLMIRDGQLNGYEPIMALSRFIDVEELRNIEFQTLENTVLIRENQVIIPAFDIRSNALNLSASGTHGFDNRYDYRIRLLLSELLYQKASRERQQEFTVAEDRSDTRTLFLKITREGGSSKVEIDRERTAQKIRRDLREEGTELKGILNRELGLFKRDQQVIESRKKEDQEEEIFTFDFSADPDSAKKESAGTEKKQRWWQRQRKKDTAAAGPVKEFVLDEKPD